MVYQVIPHLLGASVVWVGLGGVVGGGLGGVNLHHACISGNNSSKHYLAIKFGTRKTFNILH